MPLLTMKQILDDAIAKNYGVGAFNINNMEQTLAIMSAADRTESPVILQASRGARKYAGPVMIYGLVQAAMKLYPKVPVALHLDHGNNFETCKQSMDDGWTSVMMDGSLMEDGKTPSTFEYNVDVTSRVVAEGHKRGITVEGEIGTLGGIEDGHGADRVKLADPDQAVEFAHKTGVDALALAFGTSHGAFKFKAKPVLAYDIVQAVNKKMPGLAIVSHGSSSVPPELVAEINKYGGKSPARWVSRWRTSSAQSISVSERSTSTPTFVSRPLLPSAKSSLKRRRSSTSVITSGRRWKPCRTSSKQG